MKTNIQIEFIGQQFELIIFFLFWFLKQLKSVMKSLKFIFIAV